MPQAIALALVAAGLYVGLRWLAHVAHQLKAEIERGDESRQDAPRIEKDLGKLEYDPVSSVYRPAKRD
jgi:hypothetical protein